MRKLKTIEMHRMTVSDFKQSDKMPLIVMLDDVRSLHNVGSVFRSGDAFRIEAVWLCGITATPPMPEIHNATDAVDELHAMGYQVCAVEQCEGSTMLQDFVPDIGKHKGFAVIMGNEVKGVHQEVVDKSDCCLEIPQFGTKHSLNVSVTAGMVIWEFAKRLML